VLAVALQRFWAGDADGATYTALPQIERIVRVLVMSQRRGIYRVQEKHTPGQTLGLRALLPILSETHRVPEARIRLYSTSLVHPAGLNLRNLLSHGFAGFAGPEAAALVLHLLLHLGTIESPTAGDQSDQEDSQQAPDSS
jgi:Domain of unknown function (DUF4209)